MFIEKMKFRLKVFRYDVEDRFRLLQYRIWNKHLLMWWNNLYMRDDEFHSSYGIDPRAMEVMSKKERGKYLKRLFRRRSIAHKRDLND